MANQDLINQANALYYSMTVKREAADAILTYEELHNEAGADLIDRADGLFYLLSDAALRKLIDGAPGFWAVKNGVPELGLAQKRYEDLHQAMLDGNSVGVETLAEAKSLADAEKLHNELSAKRAHAVAAAKAERIKKRTKALEQAKKILPQVPKEELSTAKKNVNDAIDAYNAIARNYNDKLEAVRQSMEDNDVLRVDDKAERPDYFGEEADWDNAPHGPRSGLSLDAQRYSPIGGLKKFE